MRGQQGRRAPGVLWAEPLKILFQCRFKDMSFRAMSFRHSFLLSQRTRSSGSGAGRSCGWPTTAGGRPRASATTPRSATWTWLARAQRTGILRVPFGPRFGGVLGPDGLPKGNAFKLMRGVFLVPGRTLEMGFPVPGQRQNDLGRLWVCLASP